LEKFVYGTVSRGENTFFIFDEFNPGFLSNFVEDLFERNIADACIAGWSELLEEQHDFFLYLTEKESKINSLDHSTENLIKLYRGE
jgi:hypothetical protein